MGCGLYICAQLSLGLKPIDAGMLFGSFSGGCVGVPQGFREICERLENSFPSVFVYSVYSKKDTRGRKSAGRVGFRSRGEDLGEVEVAGIFRSQPNPLADLET